MPSSRNCHIAIRFHDDISCFWACTQHSRHGICHEYPPHERSRYGPCIKPCTYRQPSFALFAGQHPCAELSCSLRRRYETLSHAIACRPVSCIHRWQSRYIPSRAVIPIPVCTALNSFPWKPRAYATLLTQSAQHLTTPLTVCPPDLKQPVVVSFVLKSNQYLFQLTKSQWVSRLQNSLGGS